MINLDKEEEYEKEIEKYRKEIDKIDDTLVDLLNQRGNVVLKIGSLKKEHNQDTFQPAREKEILQRIKNKSTIFKTANIEAIWNEIIGASKAIQENIAKVGYLGPMGTFTHQAALELFPKSGTEFLPFNSPLEIFDNKSFTYDRANSPFSEPSRGTSIFSLMFLFFPSGILVF